MSLTTSLLAFKDPSYPKVPEEFAAHVGWMILGLACIVAVYAWLRIGSVRRFLHALEDPRTAAAARIGFAIMTFICFVNLEPYWRMLWSDEGIFDMVYAQDKLGRSALRGWTPDEGFFDLWSLACFLWSKPSLFYFWGSPDFVIGYMVAFFGFLTLFCFGVFSRITGVICWFMMMGIYHRNALYWEGTDTVYKCFWFILIFAKTGHAWSVDNWWRCRRLRKKGRLENPDAPREENVGKEPIYRLIPSWWRTLFMLQLAALYTTTGCVKTGHVWKEGNALYFALNMDHFYRFEWYTQQVSAALGTNMFRVATWTTHWWEMLFPLVLVGVALKFTLRHRDEPWYRAQNVWWRKWGGRLALIGIWLMVWRINYLVLPFCLELKKDVPQNPAAAIEKINIVYGVVVPAYAVLWYVLGKWKFTLFKGGKRFEKLPKKLRWIRIPELRIDQDTLRSWTLGRRVWLFLGFCFHGILILFMNIGMFPFIMLMTYIGYLRGDETRRVFGSFVALAKRAGPLRRLVPKNSDKWFVRAQDPGTVKLRGRQIDDWIVLALGLMGLGLIYLKIDGPEWVEDYDAWVKGWLALVIAAAATHRVLRPRAGELALHKTRGPTLAYTAIGRTIVVLFVTYHAVSVGLHLWPKFPIFNKWRAAARMSIESGKWMAGTGTSQSWRMFAPNPPQSNTFMKTVVVDANGDSWDLRNNSFYYRPNPWILNDRMRKMQRRMVGKGKWYLRYWAQYQCREWELEHGELPQEVIIKRITTKIPKPDQVAKKGPYHPRKLKPRESEVQTHKCSGDGRLPMYMKERYGLPVTDADRDRAEKQAEARQKKFDRRPEDWEKRKDFGRWEEAEKDAAERKRAANARREGGNALDRRVQPSQDAAERRRERAKALREGRPAAAVRREPQ